jgi:hypothetical protein
MVFSGTTQRFIHPQIGKFMQMMKKTTTTI